MHNKWSKKITLDNLPSWIALQDKNPLSKLLYKGKIQEPELSVIFLFSEFSMLDIQTYKRFTNKGVEYCLKWRKNNIEGWTNKMMVTVFYPIALVKHLNYMTARAIEDEMPTQKRGIIDVFPTVFDLSEKQLYLSNKRVFIGYYLWEKVKNFAQEILLV